jgi:hypothetical protein
VKTLQDRLAARVVSPVPPRRNRPEKPQNPLVSAVADWNQAIQETDRHALKCRTCNRRRHPETLARQTGTLASIDPFKPCREADALHEAEVEARRAYLAAGGTLPVDREKLRRIAR